MTRPVISVVSTLYRSSGFLDRFVPETVAAVEQMDHDGFELILVNDGSPDDSLAHAQELKRRFDQLVIVDLSRNFGHHAALQAGLGVARGDLVFLIDCDLEVPPSALVELYRKQRETGADLVFGYQESRKGGWLERVAGGLFYKLFNLVSPTGLHENLLTEQVMTRRFVDALLRLGDRNLFLGGMIAWTGFVRVGLPIRKGQREGASTYTLLKRLRLMVDAVTSFSAQPLVWLFNFGVVVTCISFAYGSYLVLRKLLFDDTLTGFTSIMTLLSLSLGITTTALGLVGIYLGKVFTQVQNRPNYIIKDIVR
jgi:putative glycosyltransferase